jgi:hypothetical protein
MSPSGMAEGDILHKIPTVIDNSSKIPPSKR